MIMKVHPSGSQDGDSITVRLTEANRRERERTAINASVAVIVGMARIVESADWESSSATISEDSQKKTLSPSETYGPRDDEERRSIGEVENRLRRLNTRESDNQRFSPMEWEKAESEIEQRKPETDHHRTRGYPYHQIAAMSAQEADRLSSRFNDAVNDSRPRTRTNVPYASLDQITRAYNKRIFRARSDIPIRERVLTIAEGEHVVTINGQH